MKLNELIEKHNFKLELNSITRNPNMEKSEEMLNYIALIFTETGSHSGLPTKKQFITFFSTGCAWVEKKPLKAGEKGQPAYGVTWSRKHNDFLVEGGKYTEKQVSNSFTSKYRIKKPTISDILNCLNSDFQSVEYNQIFEDWTNELGYSNDSIKAKETFEIILKSKRDFIRAFGSTVYKELLECESE